MKQTNFYQRLQKDIDRLNTTMPVDFALSGASISDAMYIDATSAVQAVATTDIPAGTLDIKSIAAAIPPYDSQNLFLEFNSAAVEIKDIVHGAVGVHLVAYDHAVSARFLALFGPMPEKLTCWERKYLLLTYRETMNELMMVAAGVLVALNDEGEIATLMVLPFTQDSDNEHMKTCTYFAAMIAYLVFACFGMINQQEALLTRRGENHWVIL